MVFHIMPDEATSRPGVFPEQPFQTVEQIGFWAEMADRFTIIRGFFENHGYFLGSEPPKTIARNKCRMNLFTAKNVLKRALHG